MRIGIDLGGTNIAAGLVDGDLSMIVRGSVKTPRGADAIVSEMDALARSLCDQAGLRLQDIEGAGVGSPVGSGGSAVGGAGAPAALSTVPSPGWASDIRSFSVTALSRYTLSVFRWRSTMR